MLLSRGLCVQAGFCGRAVASSLSLRFAAQAPKLSRLSSIRHKGTRRLISREVLFGNPSRVSVSISPDGKFLGYLAPLDNVLNVWVESLDGACRTPRAVTQSRDRPIMSYQWATNVEQILYSKDTGGDENFHIFVVAVDGAQEAAPLDLTPGDAVTASIAGISPDRPDEVLISSNARDATVFDLHKVNTRTGESAVKIENTGGFVGFVTDEDWNVRFRTAMTPDGGSRFEYRSNDTAAWQEFALVGPEDVLNTSPIGFSKDGSRFWMIDCRGRDTAALYELDSTGSMSTEDRKLVFESDVSDLSGTIGHPTTYEVQAVATNRLRTEWHVLDDDIQPDLEKLALLNDGEININSRTKADDKWVVAFVCDDGPTQYWIWDRTEQQGHYLFSNRPELEKIQLSKMRSLEVPTRDGLSMPSYLTLPAHHPDDGGVLPLVLLVHGGPWARDQWGYNAEHQWLADRGYAVLSVNYRASTGFGKAYLNAGNREWYGKMQDDLNDAVAWAVSQGIADASRVAIMGASYGGYAALAGVTRDPELFTCAVDIVGPSHVRTLLDTIPDYWQPMKVMFEDRLCPFDDPAYQDAISPLTHVANIQRPLLIGQGANDPRVKVSESDQIVDALDAKGIPVTYVVFPDEGHGFARPENNKAFNAITELFLAEHLGGCAESMTTKELEASTAELRRMGGLQLPLQTKSKL